MLIRVKPKSRYFVQRQELENAAGEQLLDALRDTTATNVEIRKSKAASSKVELSQYYQATADMPASRRGPESLRDRE